jgi:intracellular septation protein
MKPTIVNLLFASVLFCGSLFLKKNLLKSLLESSIQLEERGWGLLNKRWMIFFIFLAFLNEIVWRTQTEDFWVKFKVFGIIPITFIFMMFQINLIKKYKINV